MIYVHLRGLPDLDWVAEVERAFDIVMSAPPEDLNLLDIVATAAGLKAAGFELLKKSDEAEEGRFWVRRGAPLCRAAIAWTAPSSRSSGRQSKA